MFQNFLKGFTGAAKSTMKPTNTKGVGSAWLRGKKSGLSTEDQLAQDLFIQKFVSRGANALNTAIQQGLVDITSTDLGTAGSAAGPTQANGQSQSNTTSPVTATQPGGKAPGNQAVPTGSKQGAAKPQIDVNVDKIVGQMRKLQPNGTKPIPPNSKAAQSLAADIPKVSLNKDYLVNAGSTILKLNNAGYDVSDFHNQFMTQFAKGSKQKTISEDRLQEIYRRLSTQEKFRRSLKRAGYDPDEAAKRIRDLIQKQQAEREKYRDVYKDLGIDIDKYKVDLDEKGPVPNIAPQQAAPVTAPAPKPNAGNMKQSPGNFARPAGAQKLKPSQKPKAQAKPAAQQPQQATPQQAQAQAKPSIGAWLRDNFMKNFFRGINFGTAQQQVDDILKRMPQSYKAGTLNKDLTDIAQIAYAVSDQGRKQD